MELTTIATGAKYVWNSGNFPVHPMFIDKRTGNDKREYRNKIKSDGDKDGEKMNETK